MARPVIWGRGALEPPSGPVGQGASAALQPQAAGEEEGPASPGRPPRRAPAPPPPTPLPVRPRALPLVPGPEPVPPPGGAAASPRLALPGGPPGTVGRAGSRAHPDPRPRPQPAAECRRRSSRAPQARRRPSRPRKLAKRGSGAQTPPRPSVSAGTPIPSLFPPFVAVGRSRSPLRLSDCGEPEKCSWGRPGVFNKNPLSWMMTRKALEIDRVPQRIDPLSISLDSTPNCSQWSWKGTLTLVRRGI